MSLNGNLIHFLTFRISSRKCQIGLQGVHFMKHRSTLTCIQTTVQKIESQHNPCPDPKYVIYISSQLESY